MTTAGRSCVFCGAAGPLTKEHVFPQWTGDLPGVAQAVARRGRRVDNVPISFTQRRSDGQWEAVEHLRSPTAPGIQDVKVRSVCGECNRGWMSALELRAKRLITPMSQGPVEISEADQHTLAEWAFKTVLMYAQYEPRTNGFTPDVYTNFYATRRPPAGLDIHVGRCRDAVTMLWTDGRWVGPRSASTDEIMARPAVASGFIAVETVCWFVHYVAPDADLSAKARRLLSGRHLDRSRQAQRVWPPSARLSWPPPWMSVVRLQKSRTTHYRTLARRFPLSPEVRT